MIRKLLLFFLLATTAMAWADIVNENTAQKMASQFFGNATDATRECAKRRFVKTQDQTMPSYYVFDNAQGEGFVIISAEDAAYPVLGYSQKGSWPKDGVIPGQLQQLLANYDKQIKLMRAEGKEASQEVKAMWKAPLMKERGAGVELPTAKWGQHLPYNAECPKRNGTTDRCLTGCVNTALGILMKYHRWPEGLVGTSVSYVGGDNITVIERNYTHTYDWDLIADGYDENSSAESNAAVATLLADLGHILQAGYTLYNTYTLIWGYDLYALGFEFDEWFDREDAETQEQFEDAIKQSLNNSQPVLFFGGQGNDRHCFIIDGYDTEGYFRMNFGWDGNCDGYYLLNNIMPYDGYYLNFAQQAVTGIRPDRMQTPDCQNFDVGGKLFGPMRYASRYAQKKKKTVKLANDVENMKAVFEEDDKVTVDMAGHDLGVFYIDNWGDLTIKNSEETGRFILENDGYSIWNDGTLLMQNAVAIGEGEYSLFSTSSTSQTTIKNVSFTGMQLVTSYGDVVVEGGDFVSTADNWPMCLSGEGSLTVKGMPRFKAYYPVIVEDGVKVSLEGGYYSHEPMNTYVAEGYHIYNNPDSKLKAEYPYCVMTEEQYTPVNSVQATTEQRTTAYDLTGRIARPNTRGIHILRSADGKVQKVIN